MLRLVPWVFISEDRVITNDGMNKGFKVGMNKTSLVGFTDGSSIRSVPWIDSSVNGREDKAIDRLVFTYNLVDGFIDLIISEDNIINEIIRIVEVE